MIPGIFHTAWLIPALPLIGFVVVGLIVRPRWPKAAGYVATTAVVLSAIGALRLASAYFASELTPVVTANFEWLHFQDGLSVSLGIFLDPISVMLLTVVTLVSSLVHIYSLGYMHDDPGVARFFTYLNLFTFSMLGLVVAPNLVQMFVFWELVGASSFLLIGFYYQKPSAVAASKKAFIVTRFADLGFLIGMLMLGWFGFQIQAQLGQTATTSLQPFDFLFLTQAETIAKLGAFPVGVALLLIYMGAAGKSAMFPLHIWLPDAMEGPTPVSALIHAATMVVAGVYMTARLFPVFSSVPDVLHFVAVVGAFTSLFAAVIACTQDDIKRVLAFSTLSQLGYMMWSLGVASMEHPLGYTASMFHLFTHAFFKALLFLGAGAVIHAVHSNSIWDMGGLRRSMPFTHGFFAVAWLAICGVFPFAGFFSKDEMLVAALSGGHKIIFTLGLVTAACTAFYMSRIYFVTFWGNERGEKAKHAHEAPVIMLFPLAVLAGLSVVAGFVPFSHYVHLSEAAHGEAPVLVPVLGTLAALGGIAVAWLYYVRRPALQDQTVNTLGGFYRAARSKFYIDELYLFMTKRVIFKFVSQPIAWFDRNVVDGGVNLGGQATRKLGVILSLIQTGQIQTYIAWFVGGAVVVAVLKVML